MAASAPQVSDLGNERLKSNDHCQVGTHTRLGVVQQQVLTQHKCAAGGRCGQPKRVERQRRSAPDAGDALQSSVDRQRRQRAPADAQPPRRSAGARCVLFANPGAWTDHVFEAIPPDVSANTPYAWAAKHRLTNISPEVASSVQRKLVVFITTEIQSLHGSHRCNAPPRT